MVAAGASFVVAFASAVARWMSYQQTCLDRGSRSPWRQAFEQAVSSSLED